jgi:hypothetical protein
MTNNTAPSRINKPTRTGFWIKLLIAGLLLTALGGFWRLVLTMRDWPWLQSLGLVPGPLYLAISGAFWGILALAAGVSLWLKKKWAFHFARAAVAILILTAWLDRLLFSQTEDTWTNLPFSIMVSLVGMGYTLVVLARNPNADR